MSKIRSMVNGVSWFLGVICVAASLVLRLLALGHIIIAVSPRGGLVLAAVLFLCTLATGEAGKAPAGG
jgi:uncharacterized membrane protein YgdD (TMEM256/DUF423 family)